MLGKLNKVVSFLVVRLGLGSSRDTSSINLLIAKVVNASFSLSDCLRFRRSL